VLPDRTGPVGAVTAVTGLVANDKKTEFLTYTGHIPESYESHIMKNQESNNMSIKSTLYQYKMN
jgi:hypothetical protein